jgi:xanthine/uracil permease
VSVTFDVDYKDKRNLTISSVIFGIGGGRLAFAITQDVQFELAGVALATVVGIILNLIFPPPQPGNDQGLRRTQAGGRFPGGGSPACMDSHFLV